MTAHETEESLRRLLAAKRGLLIDDLSMELRWLHKERPLSTFKHRWDICRQQLAALICAETFNDLAEIELVLGRVPTEYGFCGRN